MAASTHFPADAYSQTHDDWLGTNHIVIPTLHYALRSYVRGARVLDVGCGTGFLSSVILEWGATSVDGIDISPRMIEFCRKRYSGNPKLHFIQSSVVDMKYTEEFDVALAIFVLHFNKTINELEQALSVIYKSLKKGGRLIAFVPNGVADLKPMSEQEGCKLGVRLIFDGEHRFDGEAMTVQFYALDGAPTGQTKVTFFFRQTYENALRNAGFSTVQWADPIVSEEVLKEYGEELFLRIRQQPCDAVFTAIKGN